MKSYPSLPSLDDPPEGLLSGGHLWLQELVAGRQLRFRMADSGLLAFGDRDAVFAAGDVPVPYGHAVRSVRDRFDRDALRDAANGDPERFVFFTQATVDDGVPYDRPRTPALLGFDVWDHDRESFLPPDTTERAFERLGLDPVNAFRKELPVRDFQPSRYAVPESAWYDGPAAGVVVRNTAGGTAVREQSTVETTVDAAEEHADGPAGAPDAESALAARAVTPDRIERALAALTHGPGGNGSETDGTGFDSSETDGTGVDSSEEDGSEVAGSEAGGSPPTDPAAVDSDELRDRVFELAVHEAYRRLGGSERDDWEGVRRAVGAAVRERVRDRSR